MTSADERELQQQAWRGITCGFLGGSPDPEMAEAKWLIRSKFSVGKLNPLVKTAADVDRAHRVMDATLVHLATLCGVPITEPAPEPKG